MRTHPIGGVIARPLLIAVAPPKSVVMVRTLFREGAIVENRECLLNDEICSSTSSRL